MNLNAFMDTLLAQAAAAGIETAEIYYAEGSSFSASALEGEIESYAVSDSCGLSLRGTVKGRMGYASTEAFDEDAITQLIEGVLESAALVESDEQDEIFPGEKEYPTVETAPSDLDTVSAETKLSAVLAMETASNQTDERVEKTETDLSTGFHRILLRNSYGLKLEDAGHYAVAVAASIVKDGDRMVDGFHLEAATRFDALKPEEIGVKAAESALKRLGATSVPTGEYRVILDQDAMRSLLSTFCGIFSGENAQQNLSLLAGKEGTAVASPVVTLMDDPLMPGGFATRPFDAEGSACRTKAVIQDGILMTLLHNRKTAKKQGAETTGNAHRSGFSGPMRVAPSNFFFKPGTKNLPALAKDMGEGLVITDLSGLHAGANPATGDFSLSAKGFKVEGGEITTPVEQITVAGNFYQLLQNIVAVGSDLRFPGSGIGAPSVDVGTMSVSGT